MSLAPSSWACFVDYGGGGQCGVWSICVIKRRWAVSVLMMICRDSKQIMKR